jgi:nucleotide-binding universal stress UspA family protein
MTVCHEEGRTWEAPGLVRRILCAVDFSDASEATLAGALALAAEHQATVTLVHVVEPLPVGAEPFYFANSLREELERNADQKLAGLARDAEARTGITVHERLATGRPFAEILRIAAEEQADLVVIGPGLGALDRFLWGSNAQHVVREATCPVLTMRGLAARAPAREGRGAVALRAG